MSTKPWRKFTETPTDVLPTIPEHALIVAVIRQGLEEFMKGDGAAERWLCSPYFDHWCDHLNLNPDYIRRQVQGMRARGEKMPHLWNTQPSDLRRKL